MKTILLIFLSMFSLCGYCQSLPEVLARPEFYDKQTVTLEGEVIGEAIKADKGYWINCASGAVTIGLFVEEKEQLKAITRFGSYAVQGDLVRVTGIFHRDCPVHHERDIHVLALTVIKKGYIHSRAVPQGKIRAVLILATICLTMIAIYFIKERYGKRNTAAAK